MIVLCRQICGWLVWVLFITFYVIWFIFRSCYYDHNDMPFPAHYLCAIIRNIQFFGLEFQQKVTASYVVVIGLGGVGSHAASMLLRSGVGRLLLVDFDQVSSFYSFLFFISILVFDLSTYIVLVVDDSHWPTKPCLESCPTCLGVAILWSSLKVLFFSV